jgi:outer membrane protein assembly factor BamB
MGGMIRRGPRWMFLMAVATAIMLSATACENWTQYMGHPSLDGNASAEHTINKNNVGTLQESFRVAAGAPDAQVLTPTVSDGIVYASSVRPDGTAELVASLEIAGDTCTGTPKVCPTLWHADLPTLSDNPIPAPPLIANHIVYESVFDNDLSGGQTFAFDANGVTNCSGSPKACQPLWSAPGGAVFGPNVDAGHLFVTALSFDHATDQYTARLEELDAMGVDNCGGTPKVCQPRWTAPIISLSTPSIANGKVYVAGAINGARLVAVYDEAGTTSCAGSGSSRVCQPLFTAALPLGMMTGSVAVSGNVFYYAIEPDFPNSGQLVAFDANGVTNCAGAPAPVCQPLWTGTLTGVTRNSTPAVAGGRVYVVSTPAIQQTVTASVVDVFDAAGTAGCTGTPVVCAPLMTALDSSANDLATSPTIANGLLYVGGRAFDASGSLGCIHTGTPPITCAPLWNVPNGLASNTTIVDATVIAGGSDGFVHVYRLP